MSTAEMTAGELRATQNFFDGVANAAAESKTGRLSVEQAAGLTREATVAVPPRLQGLLAVIPENMHHSLLDSVRLGQSQYLAAHGRAPDPSLTVAALSRAMVDMMPLKELGIRGVLDAATNLHHDQISLQPAAAILAVLNMFNEAHPLAAYLPTDTKSNEARIIIARHVAQSDHGDYAVGDSLNGIDAGGNYFEGERLIDMGNAGGASFNVTVTARNGLPVSASNVAVKLLRGRTIIMVDGIPVAREALQQSGSGPNTVAGQVTIAGTSHAISGSSNSDTGDITVTFSPAMPVGHNVSFMAYLDYEREPNLAPTIGFEAEMFQLFAHASRGLTTLTIDASTQFSQEAGLDARGQMQLALRNQFAAERFYRANQKMLNIARAFPAAWNYDYSTQIAQKDYYQLFLNLAPILAQESQKMAERTNDHGIDTIFMTGKLAALTRGLPSTIWETSGIVNRPGVYRMGKLFGLYDVYYTPKGLSEDAAQTTTEMLCMGRGTTIARNPLVMGDAVPAMLIPLATNSNLNTNDGFYTRSFSEVNPHQMSAKAATLITVTNMG